jgi:hypothetical protein
MFEEVEMIINDPKAKQNLHYIQFVPHSGQHRVLMRKTSRRQQYWYMAVAYIENCI